MSHKVGFGLTDYQFKKLDSGRTSFVSGVFDKPEQAEDAVQRLERRGVARERISVLMSDEVRKSLGGDKVRIEKGSKAAEGLGTGGAIGGTVGAVLGLIVAGGASLAIPGLGILLAGPLAGALAGAGAGGATGGLLGMLVGMGLPEYRAKHYAERVKAGGIVVGVEAGTDDEADRVEEDLKEAGAEEVKQS